MTFLGADVDRLHSFGGALRVVLDHLGAHASTDSRLARALHLVEESHSAVKRCWHELSFGRMAAADVDAWSTNDRRWFLDRFQNSATTADDALRGVLSNGAEASFADLLSNDAVLLFGASDFTLVAEFWLRMTDPRVVGAAEAGRRIRRLLESVRTYRENLVLSSMTPSQQADHRIRDRDVDQLLALVVAPWSLHFTALAADWGWSPREGLAEFERILSHRAVASAVSVALPAAVDRELSDLPADPIHRRERIDDVAAGAGATIEAVVRAELEHERPLDFVDDVVSLVPWGSWVTSIAAGVTASSIVSRLDHRAADARTSARSSVDQRSILANIAAGAVADDAVERGVIGRSARSIPESLRNEIELARLAFDSPADRGGSFVESGGTSQL